MNLGDYWPLWLQQLTQKHAVFRNRYISIVSTAWLLNAEHCSVELCFVVSYLKFDLLVCNLSEQ